jgi:hypothetical protein
MALLGGLPGVVHVAAAPADAGPGVGFVVGVEDPTPVQRALAGAVVARGWALLEVRAEPTTLEDLFLRLVRPAEH